MIIRMNRSCTFLNGCGKTKSKRHRIEIYDIGNWTNLSGFPSFCFLCVCFISVFATATTYEVSYCVFHVLLVYYYVCDSPWVQCLWFIMLRDFIYNAEIILRWIVSFLLLLLFFSYKSIPPLLSALWIVLVRLQSKLHLEICQFPLISEICTLCTCISYVVFRFQCCLLYVMYIEQFGKSVSTEYVQMGKLQCKIKQWSSFQILTRGTS